jgi:hypothetical protein
MMWLASLPFGVMVAGWLALAFAIAAMSADPGTARALANLERTVRAEAARPALGTPSSTELLTALDSLTTARRQRLAAASHAIPLLYVMTLVASGAA